MEAASPAESKCAATGCREPKPKAAMKVCPRRRKASRLTKNLKGRNAAAAATQQVEAT
jgi:hypothetical protein